MSSKRAVLQLIILSLTLGAIAPTTRAAQVPYPIKDINDESPRADSMASARCYTGVRGVAYFQAMDPIFGFELWRSDGSAIGTTRVTDLGPGFYDTIIGILGTLDDQLIFWALHTDQQNQWEIWRTDGSPGGTTLIKSGLWPGQYLPTAARLGGALYFPATDDEHGSELWRTDGTPDGTRLVKDIVPGPDHSMLSEGWAVVGSTLFFPAYHPTHGTQLWRSDGSASGTRMVKAISRPFEPDPRNLTAVGGRLFFSVSDGIHGDELWRSDGTSAGTVMVKDIAKGKPASSPWHFITANGRLFFTADGEGILGEFEPELWTSDGTPSGTRMVKDITPGPHGSHPQNLTRIGQLVYFSALDPEHPSGFQLWVTDGTDTGTIRLTDDLVSLPGEFTAGTDRRLYFVGQDASRPARLWRSDGTREGTGPVPDPAVGGGDIYPYCLASVGRHLFFAAWTPDTGNEPWALDLPRPVPTRTPRVP